MSEITIDSSDLRKSLMTNKTNASFSRYENGELYYSIVYNHDVFEFPINTLVGTEPDTFTVGDAPYEGDPLFTKATDVGTTPFKAVMPARELWRWISKAHSEGELIKIR